jgi:hypothetical protein
MSDAKGGSAAAPPPLSTVSLLGRDQTTVGDRNLARLLDFFGIPWKAVSTREWKADAGQAGPLVIISADCLAEAMGSVEASGLPPCVMKARAVFVYGFQEDERSVKLLRLVTGDPQGKIKRIRSSQTTVRISADIPEVCGPMSGLQVPISLCAAGSIYELGLAGSEVQRIIRSAEGELFLRVNYEGVPFYLSAWESIIDIDVFSPLYFDVKKFFCEAVPIVLFLRWGFPENFQSHTETSACLIVDDPPLKRRYGFLDFSEALDLMDRDNFSTTIAFIPWNWRRTHHRTLRMFQAHPKRLSVVFHGCDHTEGEFVGRSPALLGRMLDRANERMARFERKACISVDRVMVFPQGRFSPEAGRALKLNQFVAVVNTEVSPDEQAANETRISDLWRPAIMKYRTFPIITRRYLSHGVENFAFDGVLGKPCLIAAHHDVFRDHGRDLVDFIGRLNALKWTIVWRPLSEVVRRNFTTRRLADGTRIIRMFSGSLLVENSGAELYKALLLKAEDDPSYVEAVWVNDKRSEFSIEGGELRAWLMLRPQERATVHVAYRNTLELASDRRSFAVSIRVAAKRYLSEFRDNYLCRNDFLYRSAQRLKARIFPND